MKRIRFSKVSLALVALGCSGKLDVGDRGVGGVVGDGGRATGGRITQDGGWPHSGSGGVGKASMGGSQCIPADATPESLGTVAEVEVKTLSRCAEGYRCGLGGRCEPLPACEPGLRGDCLVSGSLPEGGTGGASGTGGYATGGSSAGNPPLAQEHSAITGITADDSRVYWVAYGTRDRLGNYNQDGSLNAFSLADGTVTILASDLAGPTGVGVTSGYAYVVVDGGALIGTEERAEVFRVPLAGGDKALVQSSHAASNQFRAFFAAGPHAFWPAGSGTIYAISDEDAVASTFLPSSSSNDTGWPLAANDTYLYYQSWGQYPGVRRISVADAPTADLARPSRPLAVRGEFMYGIEVLDNGAGLMLSRAPTAGGNWVRTRGLGGEGMYPYRMQLAGDRYFFDRIPNSSVGVVPMSVLTASLESDEPPIRLLERNIGYTESVWWVGTADALFWTDGNALYRRALE